MVTINYPSRGRCLDAYDQLTDQELHRIRLIAAAENTSPAKVYRLELKFWIEEGIYDEVLTGHECP